MTHEIHLIQEPAARADTRLAKISRRPDVRVEFRWLQVILWSSRRPITCSSSQSLVHYIVCNPSTQSRLENHSLFGQVEMLAKCRLRRPVNSSQSCLLVYLLHE